MTAKNMIKSTITAVAFGLLATAGSAADLVTKNSPHSVQVTMDKLVAAVEGAGARVAARVDHSAAAKTVGIDMPPNQVLIFGNPNIGSPIFVENPAAGLDLPIRVVVYQDEAEGTIVAYHSPDQLAADYGLSKDMKSLKMMAGALGKLTAAATAP